MDVRLSPEQEALRDSAARMVDRWGPGTVAQLGDPERADKLEAAVAAAGWRELRVAEGDGAPLASGVEAAIVAEELGRGLADTPFLGPTLAAELRRLAGAPAADRVRDGRPGSASLSGLAVAVDGVAPAGAVAVDARGASAALVLVPTDSGHRLASVPRVGPRAAHRSDPTGGRTRRSGDRAAATARPAGVT